MQNNTHTHASTHTHITVANMTSIAHDERPNVTHHRILNRKCMPLSTEVWL